MATKKLGVITQRTDYQARGLASEAIQALRSHDELDKLRFENMEKQHKELVELIQATNARIEEGFKAYDAKFWSLAVTIIILLCGTTGALVFKVLYPK